MLNPMTTRVALSQARLAQQHKMREKKPITIMLSLHSKPLTIKIIAITRLVAVEVPWVVGWILIMRKEKVKEEVDDIVAAVASLPLGLMKVVYIRTIMPIMEDQEAKVLDITTIIRDLIIKEVACETLVVEMVAIKAMATTIIINLATIRVDKDLTTTTIIKEVAIIIIAKAM